MNEPNKSKINTIQAQRFIIISSFFTPIKAQTLNKKMNNKPVKTFDICFFESLPPDLAERGLSFSCYINITIKNFKSRMNFYNQIYITSNIKK